MEKLRQIITDYPKWKSLEVYIDRIEGMGSIDFSLALENAKALLESIAREICDSFSVEVEPTASTNKLLNKAFGCFDNDNSEFTRKVSGSLATIGEQLANIRNDIGITSHGKTLEAIATRNDIDESEKDFFIGSTTTVCILLIRYYEKQKSQAPVEEPLDYSKEQIFNDYLDNEYGEVIIGEYSYTASEVLYNVDYNVYKSEYINFINNQKKPNENS